MTIKKPLITLSLLSILITAPAPFVFAIDSPNQAGNLERVEQDILRDRAITEKIETPKAEEEKAIVEEGKTPLEAGKKLLIKKIDVRGATLVSPQVIGDIASQFEGKELSIADMQKVCDLITDEYRKRGYVTSRAYLPPQTIREGVLVIMVIEGRLGSIDVKGNRFFSASVLKKKIRLTPGKSFDYKSLQKSLRYINEHPDRHAKAILVPGKDPGTTDIVLEVEDRFPGHAGIEYDNFGSRYTKKWRFAAIAEHNNFLGLDDRFYFKYQKAGHNLMNFINFRYILPLIPTWTDIGAYYIWNNIRLSDPFKESGVKGKATVAGLFISQRLLYEYNINLNLTAGFDYKRVRNFQSGNVVSKDEPRVLKGGFDMDVTDAWGRTIFTFETDVALSRFLGGAGDEDSDAARPGSRGDFTKFLINLYRLQPMPFSSVILVKNQAQFSDRTLFSVEQFQLGGVSNVRAYPPAEQSGDTGISTSAEWSFPILMYLLPKSLESVKVPSSKSTFTDALRLVIFYDVGAVHNNKDIPGERKSKLLNGCGFGFRFNLPEDFSTRIEFAAPLGSDPSDDRDFRTYFGLYKLI